MPPPHRSPSQPSSRRDSRMVMWTAVAAVAAAVGVLATSIFGGVAVLQSNVVQSKDNSIQQASQNAELEAAMIELDEHFFNSPKIYPFFYADLHDNQTALPPPGRLRRQAFSTGERIIDLTDEIGAYMRTNTMVGSDAVRWGQLMRAYFVESPTLRLLWKLYYEPYGRDTACLLGAPETPRAWNWRSNSPREQWPDDCTAIP
jgi:hypothetical protein